MSITKEIRNQVFDQASNVVEYLYSDYSSGEKMFSIAEKFDLIDTNKYKAFARTVGDIILGFYKIEDTVPLLQQELGLNAKTAALLGADVLDFLSPLSDPNWQAPIESEYDEDIEGTTAVLNEELIPVAISSHEPIAIPVTQTQSVTETIPQLRTMAADMIEGRSPVRSTFNAGATIDEPIYTSTQPTLERATPAAPSYTAPMYEQPKPNVDAPLEKPRWG